MQSCAALVVATNDYYPYGLPISGREILNTISSEANKFKYQGKELDAESQLYDFGARLYDKDRCQFVQIDPTGMIGGACDNGSSKKEKEEKRKKEEEETRKRIEAEKARIAFMESVNGSQPIFATDELGNLAVVYRTEIADRYVDSHGNEYGDYEKESGRLLLNTFYVEMGGQIIGGVLKWLGIELNISQLFKSASGKNFSDFVYSCFIKYDGVYLPCPDYSGSEVEG